MDEPQPSPRAGPLAAILFSLIALLTIGALALTQELRSRPDVVNDVDKIDRQAIRFNLTRADSNATVAVVDRGGDVVAEPIADEPLAAGVVYVEWDGRVEATGEAARPGVYRIRFDLGELGRRAFLPKKFRIGAQG